LSRGNRGQNRVLIVDDKLVLAPVAAGKIGRSAVNKVRPIVAQSGNLSNSPQIRRAIGAEMW
jgi:hypothetical protein